MIKTYQIDVVNSLFSKMLEHKEDYVLDPIVDCQPEFQAIIETAIERKIQIRNSWLNRTEYKNLTNKFDWHNEQGVGGQGTVMPGTHTGILWIDGSEDNGGDLGVMDATGSVSMIKFKKGKLITFPIEYLHKVEEYTGTQPRVSVNIAYE